MTYMQGPFIQYIATSLATGEIIHRYKTKDGDLFALSEQEFIDFAHDNFGEGVSVTATQFDKRNFCILRRIVNTETDETVYQEIKYDAE